jgi:hypothetical protein
MNDGSAAEALAEAVTAALRQVARLSSVADGVPIQAGDAHAVVEIGPETDWGHKSGAGAEIRFALLVRCGGGRPDRARQLLCAVREQVAGLGPEFGSWRLVSLAMMRSRVVREPGPRWTGSAEYRVRLLQT